LVFWDPKKGEGVPVVDHLACVLSSNGYGADTTYVLFNITYAERQFGNSVKPQFHCNFRPGVDLLALSTDVPLFVGGQMLPCRVVELNDSDAEPR
jgi:hypothetical protein